MWIFVTVTTTVLHHLWLVESTNVELWIWRANCKVICGFLTAERVGTPNSRVVQG